MRGSWRGTWKEEKRTKARPCSVSDAYTAPLHSLSSIPAKVMVDSAIPAPTDSGADLFQRVPGLLWSPGLGPLQDYWLSHMSNTEVPGNYHPQDISQPLADESQ